MPPTERPLTEPVNQSALRLERRGQVRGSLLFAGIALTFALVRGGIPTIFHPGWWRLW